MANTTTTRRRLAQFTRNLKSTMSGLALTSTASTMTTKKKTSSSTTTTSQQKQLSIEMQRKYIQCQSMPKRRRIAILLLLSSLGLLVVVDRLTTSTTSSSKWARMMYEDDTTSNNKKLLRGQASPIIEDIRPKDLHIAFVGDSVTRYMYLDLVYYLQHNRWVADTDAPNILNAKHFPSWNDHYNASNLALSGNEECDCFRNNPANASAINKEETIENRYYRDITRNNYVTFIEIFGGYPAHGHWTPEQVFERQQQQPDQQQQQQQQHERMDFDKLQSDPFVWRYDWPGLIRNYLHALDPKPHYLVFNEGLWIEHELGHAEVRQSIKDALEDTGIIGIYKTTTLPNINSGLAKRSAGVVFNRHDDAMSELIGNVLDFTWTKDLGDEHYWDGVHFMPHVNRGMNKELLDYLQKMDEANKEPPQPRVVDQI